MAPHVSPSYLGLGHSWISEGRLEDTAESSLLSCSGMLSGGGVARGEGKGVGDGCDEFGRGELRRKNGNGSNCIVLRRRLPCKEDREK